MPLLQALIGFLSGGIGRKVGSGVANLTALAMLAPVALWLMEHKEEAAVTLTYGQLALFGAFAFCIVKVIHYTRAPGPAEVAPWYRGGDQQGFARIGVLILPLALVLVLAACAPRTLRTSVCMQPGPGVSLCQYQYEGDAE